MRLANAQPGEREFDAWVMGRATIEPLRSERIATYIRTKTRIDDRVFSPHPNSMTVLPVAQRVRLPHTHSPVRRDGSGIRGHPRLSRTNGNPPTSFKYLHATDAWVESLPDRAQAWLRNPDLFELLLRDDRDCPVPHPAGIPEPGFFAGSQVV